MAEDAPTRPMWDNTVDGVTRVVSEAAGLGAGDRRVFLDRVCAHDGALRAEVETMLAALDDAGGAPERIGRYRIVSQLGEGGMGTVYLAEQDVPVKRRVALKVIRVLHQPSLRRRFAAECQALARLNHPNVASMYEAGVTGDGLPYVAMEWIDGQRITAWCDMAESGIEARLRLFLDVCAGVKHAHEKGVLHLDLKPSNVLVTRVTGGAEVPKVIDFGIARALDEPLLAGAHQTQELVLGSPPYMSPEAMTPAGRRHLDLRSDVYSLGLILFELLTGLLPYEAKGRSIWSLLRHLKGSTPTAPSKRLTAAMTSATDDDRVADIAALRRATPRRLVRRLSGDLDAIVSKAIDRDPDRRYGSPAELAVDLRRHLGHRPVEARELTMPYRVGRFARRNAAGLLVAALLLAVLGFGLVARTIEARRANAEAARAKRALEESEQVSAFMVDLFEGADPERAAGEAITVRELLDQGAERLRDELSDQPLVRARFLQTIGSIYTKIGELEPAAEAVTDALDIRRRHRPVGHADILESENALGVVYRRQGRHDQAEPLLLSVLAARQRDAETDPEMLAIAHTNLGNVYWGQSRFDEAQAAHREALAIRQRLEAADSTRSTRTSAAVSANNLGVMLLSRRRYGEARPFLEQAVEVFRAEGHPHLAAALNNLGLVERNLPTWANADELFREAGEVWEAAYGAADDRSLNARRNRVAELRMRHRFDEAIALARTAVELAEQTGNARLALAVRSLRGSTEYRAGRLDAAARTLRALVADAAVELGPEHTTTLLYRSRLAVVLAASGKSLRAREMLEEIDRSLVDAGLAATGTHRLRSTRHRGHAMSSAGRFAEAEALYRQAVERSIERYGDDDPLVAYVWRFLGRSLAAQGRRDEARAVLARALAIYRERYGDDHPEVGTTAFDLGQVELARGQANAAREQLERAVAVLATHYPPDDPDRARAAAALRALPR